MKKMECSLPHIPKGEVTLAHGNGGKETAALIESIFRPHFCNEWLEQEHDGAVIAIHANQLAFSTDTFVIDPLFFPGGNIGDLAVNGTVNDVACCGARPLYLSAGFVLEEGLPMDDLQKIVKSMAEAAEEAGVAIVTGDTKVVPAGKCDKIYINTSGIGWVSDGIHLAPRCVCPGDAILVSGCIGAHGIAVLSCREHLGFDAAVKSDTAPLNRLTLNLLAGLPEIHLFRDPTRGGLAQTLLEVTQACGYCIEIEEEKIPISEAVEAACDLLGLDPLHIANEGVLVVILPGYLAEDAKRLMQSLKYGKDAAIIGRVTDKKGNTVTLKTLTGGHCLVEPLSGEQLPRIC